MSKFFLDVESARNQRRFHEERLVSSERKYFNSFRAGDLVAYGQTHEHEVLRSCPELFGEFRDQYLYPSLVGAIGVVIELVSNGHGWPAVMVAVPGRGIRSTPPSHWGIIQRPRRIP
jgi:hypothetical protein